MTFEKKHYLAFGIIVLLITIASLSRTPNFRLYDRDMTASMGSAGRMMAEDMAIEVEAPTGNMMMRRVPISPLVPPSAGQTAASVDQKIIKTASLDLAVDDVSGVAARIGSIATSKGGFIQMTDVQERRDGTKFGTVTVRVPSSAFESVIASIKGEAKLVERESVNGRDVTEEYTDLEAQLRNAQAQERTYLAVLDKARTVEEILNVQNYLGQIRGQIESLQGRIQYLKNVTELSTITVTLREDAAVRVPTKEFRPSESVQAAIQAVVEIAQQLVVGLIWLVIVGGAIGLPLALLAYLLYRLFRRK